MLVHLRRSPWSPRPVCGVGWVYRSVYIDPRFRRPRLEKNRYCSKCRRMWINNKSAFWTPSTDLPNLSESSYERTD